MPENLYGSPIRDEFFKGPPAAVWEPSPHKAVAGLLELLPRTGTCWPTKDRDSWLAALSSVMGLLYVESAEQVKLPPVLTAQLFTMGPSDPPKQSSPEEQIKEMLKYIEHGEGCRANNGSPSSDPCTCGLWLLENRLNKSLFIFTGVRMPGEEPKPVGVAPPVEMSNERKQELEQMYQQFPGWRPEEPQSANAATPQPEDQSVEERQPQES